MSRFEYCLDKVLGEEGGFSDRKGVDRGGRTNFGITTKTYDAYRTAIHLPLQDVKDIQNSEVEAIYMQYWKGASCALMPEPLDLIMLDTAINSGAGKAVKLLQRGLGIDEDGICGRGTLTALHEEIIALGITQLCNLYLDNRLAFMDAIVANDPSQAANIHGWHNRIEHLRGMI
jgi:lysozyme family protein